MKEQFLTIRYISIKPKLEKNIKAGLAKSCFHLIKEDYDFKTKERILLYKSISR